MMCILARIEGWFRAMAAEREIEKESKEGLVSHYHRSA